MRNLTRETCAQKSPQTTMATTTTITNRESSWAANWVILVSLPSSRPRVCCKNHRRIPPAASSRGNSTTRPRASKIRVPKIGKPSTTSQSGLLFCQSRMERLIMNERPPLPAKKSKLMVEQPPTSPNRQRDSQKIAALGR